MRNFDSTGWPNADEDLKQNVVNAKNDYQFLDSASATNHKRLSRFDRGVLTKFMDFDSDSSSYKRS